MPIIPSPEEMEAAKSARGGWTRAALAKWGIPWPPPRKWKKKLEAQWRKLHGEPQKPRQPIRDYQDDEFL